MSVNGTARADLISGKKLHIVYASSEISVGSMACCINDDTFHFTFARRSCARNEKPLVSLESEAVFRLVAGGLARARAAYPSFRNTPRITCVRQRVPQRGGRRLRNFGHERETTALAVVVRGTV